MSERTEIDATVLAYVPDAMVDDFDDGGFASYDATRLQVVRPVAWVGEALTIHHDSPPPGDSPWRAKGRRLRFNVAAKNLRPGTVLFAGAVADLQAEVAAASGIGATDPW